jgi:hypothetical protein
MILGTREVRWAVIKWLVGKIRSQLLTFIPLGKHMRAPKVQPLLHEMNGCMKVSFLGFLMSVWIKKITCIMEVGGISNIYFTNNGG